MKTTRLTRCDNYWQANLLNGALESAGIPCAVHNEFNLYSFGIANGMTGVDVLVYEDDLERARELMNNVLQESGEEPEGWDEATEEGETPEP